jgi:hypothetical protein
MSQTPPTSGQKVYYRQTGTFTYTIGWCYPMTGTIVKMAKWDNPSAPGPLVDSSEIDWTACP